LKQATDKQRQPHRKNRGDGRIGKGFHASVGGRQKSGKPASLWQEAR
jgi:hypothetical protein